MELAVARKERRGIPSQVAANRRFGKFAPEKEQPVRRIDVKENELIKQMRETWKSCDYDARELITPDGNYARITELVKDLHYTAEDVEKFSIMLIEFEGEESFSEKAGLFLSALINNGGDETYTIHTNYIPEICSLGYKNTKNIIVNGNVSGRLGYSMEGGSITVKGDAKYSVGFLMENGTIVIEGNVENLLGDVMKGGSITVKGNAGTMVGNQMEGGSIIVRGNAEDDVGLWMTGGKITVDGNLGTGIGHFMKDAEIHIQNSIENISADILTGRIYYKGKPIVDK